MEKDDECLTEKDDESPTKKPRIGFERAFLEECDFEDTPFKLKWLMFLHIVRPCLVSNNGAILPWRTAKTRGITMHVFTVSIRQAPTPPDEDATMGTIEVYFMNDQLKTMLVPFLSTAVFSETYATQQLMNYVRESGMYSQTFCHENREAILDAPYFICDTEQEATDKLHAWIKTTSGAALTVLILGKRVPDNPLPETTRKDEDMPETRRGEEKEEEFMCMICMDAEPSTMVKPCGHVVVCSSCSGKLGATADARMCVRCRTVIESVEDLVSGAVTFV